MHVRSMLRRMPPGGRLGIRPAMPRAPDRMPPVVAPFAARIIAMFARDLQPTQAEWGSGSTAESLGSSFLDLNVLRKRRDVLFCMVHGSTCPALLDSRPVELCCMDALVHECACAGRATESQLDSDIEHGHHERTVRVKLVIADVPGVCAEACARCSDVLRVVLRLRLTSRRQER